MDATAATIIFYAVGVVVFVVLWIRVRALETLVSEESERRLELTRQAIDTLYESMLPVTRVREVDTAEVEGQGA